MPNIKGKKFPYTKKGKAAAKAYSKGKGKSKPCCSKCRKGKK